MKTILKIFALVSVSAVMLASCSKDDSRHLDTDPYSMYIGNVSGNASSVLKSGDVVTFDVILQYLDPSVSKGYKEVTDNGTVTSIELSEGLILESFGKVRVGTSLTGEEKVTVRLPHGYGNGSDMIKVQKLSVSVQ